VRRLAAYLPLLQSLLDRADALGDFGVGLKLEWSTMQTPTKFLQVEALAAVRAFVGGGGGGVKHSFRTPIAALETVRRWRR
jgi:hypothetical protein